jgi:hypothetical protein
MRNTGRQLYTEMYAYNSRGLRATVYQSDGGGDRRGVTVDASDGGKSQPPPTGSVGQQGY